MSANCAGSSIARTGDSAARRAHLSTSCGRRPDLPAIRKESSSMSWVDAIGSHPEESRAEQGGDQIQEKSIHELMKNDRRFDEVMIVNPYDPANGAGEGAKVMQFHYAQTPGYGYYSARPYGYYGATPGYGAWGSGWSGVPGYGYAAEPEIAQAGDVGYYADDYPMGYYADPWEGTQWGEADVQPFGYVSSEPPTGFFAHGHPV